MRQLIETPELDKILRPQWLKPKTYTVEQQCEVDALLDKHVWITAKRRKIHVKDMTTVHIKNCIRCWNGQGNMTIPKDYLGGREKWMKIFNNELANRS